MSRFAHSFAFQDEIEVRPMRDISISSGPITARRTTINHHPSAWMEHLADRFNKITSLPIGWDGYDGVAVKFTTARFAAQVIENLFVPDLDAPSIVPGSDGSMQVEWHLNGYDVELDFLDPLKVVAYRLDHATQLEEEIDLESDFTVVAGWIADLAVNRVLQAEQVV